MAGLREGSTDEDVTDGIVVTPAIKVNQARQLFGVKGDEILAHNLQDKEFEAKYSWNREVRRTARTDVPLAKSTHDEEEERLQRERLHFLQSQTRLTEEDAELARQYDREEQLAKQRERLRQEALDQAMANRIQAMEVQEQGQPKVRRSRDDNERVHPSSDGHPLGGSVIRMSSFPGFHLDTAPGDDGLTEDERKHLLMLQDEELALALQEHEQMRALRSERSRVAALTTADGHVTQSFVPVVVIPAQQERLQLTAAHDIQTSRGGSVRVVGYSPPSYGQSPQPYGMPTRHAPHASVHHDEYRNTVRTTRKPDDVSDKSVTLVTSVGRSEFFRTVPTSEAAAESRSQQRTVGMAQGPTRRGDATTEVNRTHSAQTNRQTSSQDAGRKSNRRK